MWFRASTDQLCDDGIVILPEAWREDMPPLGLDVADNVPLLDSHDYWTIGNIIGAPVDFEIDKEGLLLLLDFAAAEPHPRGRMAWYLASEGYLKAGSVGWKTLAWEEGETDTGTKYDIVTRARLLEFSLCVMGMDDKALAVKGNPMAEAAVRALSREDEAEEQEKVPETEPDRIRDLAKAVEAIGRSLAGLEDQLKPVVDGFALATVTLSTSDGVHNIDDGPLIRFLKARAERSELTGPEAMDALYKAGREKG
jgi:phage head maturation protease